MSALKKQLRRLFYQMTSGGKPQYQCPICGYRGVFKDKRISRDPDLVRIHTKCLGCDSKERHRMMHLLFGEFFPNKGDAGKSVLHIAPEDFMRPFFAQRFDIYHTADLFMPDVDFKEDLQNLSFAAATYDCVVVSRVLTCPPNLEACIQEMRRVLRKGGIAIIAEIYTHEKTVEFGKFVGERSREVGVDAIDLYRKHFGRVELIMSDRYAPEYQRHNRILHDGKPKDDYPERIRIPGVGFKDVVAVCYA
jgi:SAM-dependent methyltransferase